MTVWQKAVLDLFGECKCLKYSQMLRYCSQKYEMQEHQFSGLIHRLRLQGLLYTDGEYISLPHRQADSDLIAAFDILLDLAGGEAENITRKDSPFSLGFTLDKDGRTNIFEIAVVHIGEEEVVKASLMERNSNIKTVLLLDALEQRENLASLECFYAVYDRDEKIYRYYKSGQPGNG